MPFFYPVNPFFTVPIGSMIIQWVKTPWVNEFPNGSRIQGKRGEVVRMCLRTGGQKIYDFLKSTRKQKILNPSTLCKSQLTH